MMKSKKAASSDLTVDTYPSPSDDVLPVFCLNQLRPVIYHPVLLTTDDSYSTIPSLSSLNAIPSSSNGEMNSGDPATESSATIAALHAKLHHMHDDGDESAGNDDDVAGVPASLRDRAGGRAAGVGGFASAGLSSSMAARVGGSDKIAGSDEELAPAPATSSRSAPGRKRANSHLRMPKGDSGRGLFAQACKNYVGKWEDAEWTDGPSVPRGEGIPGKWSHQIALPRCGAFKALALADTFEPALHESLEHPLQSL